METINDIQSVKDEQNEVLEVKSIKKRKKIVFIVLWIITVASITATVIYSISQWENYLEGQNAAVKLLSSFTDQFNDTDIREQKVRKMYNYLNPHSYDKYENSREFYSLVSSLDKNLGDLLKEMGYTCERCSEYLKYATYSDYTFNLDNNIMFLVVLVVIMIVVIGILNALYITDKRELILQNDRIIVKKRTGKKMEFLIPQIVSVEQKGKTGLIINGQTNKYKITKINNAKELKDIIFQKISETQSVSTEYLNNAIPINEKIIIEGKFSKNKKPLLILMVLSAVIYIFTIINAIIHSVAPIYTPGDFLDCCTDFFEVLFTGRDPYISNCHFGVLLVALICIITYFVFFNGSLTVTNEKIYGKTSFGIKSYLQINKIVSVRLGLANSIIITSSTGKIIFWLLNNKSEIYEAISNLITEPQEVKILSKKIDTVDELKKYKELLDSGVISQEEFEEKKKQLLG